MNSRLIRAATLDRFSDLARNSEGVHLRGLPPFTTLLVQTVNSVYHVVITQGPEVQVQGGAFFPDLTAAYFDGASLGGHCLKVGWICVGLVMEFRSNGQRVVTSPVRAVTTVHASGSRAH